MENTKISLSEVPNVKFFTVKQLKSESEGGVIYVPPFQRWIRLKNKKELESSINLVGLLRCPVIFHVEELKRYLIIDGNHIRELIIESQPEENKIACIYERVGTYEEAAQAFKLLNTKGLRLDWVDITNLYMHVYGHKSVYADVWRIITRFDEKERVFSKTNLRGFSVPTIIEFLTKNKSRYREGDLNNKRDLYRSRMLLLSHLMDYAEELWEIRLQPVIGNKRPSGTAINGFANYWFSKKMFEKYSDGDFLDFITDIYIERAEQIKNTSLVILRDNAPYLMKDYIMRYEKKQKRKRSMVIGN
jgi:hypothetical protein